MDACLGANHQNHCTYNCRDLTDFMFTKQNSFETVFLSFLNENSISTWTAVLVAYYLHITKKYDVKCGYGYSISIV